MPKGGKIGEALSYGLNHWDGLTRFLDDGRIEIDSNTVERSIRGLALNRNYAHVRIMRSCRDGGHESTPLSLWEASSLRSATAHN